MISYSRYWLIVCLALAISSPALAGRIILFEGNDATQDRLGEFSDRDSRNVNLKRSPIDSDEIRSLKLEWVLPGTRILLFDDPDGRKNDDWTEIEILRPGPGIVIPSLEETRSGPWYRMTHHHVNGLDGKVSHVKVRPGDLSQADRRIRAYQAILDLHPWTHKDFNAHELSSAGSNYRIWFPDISVRNEHELMISLKFDHIRGGAKDDHAHAELYFDEEGRLTDMLIKVQIQDDHGLLSETLGDIWGAIPAEAVGDSAKLLGAAISESISSLYDTIVSRWAEHGGRTNFPSLIEHQLNEIGHAIVSLSD